MSCRTDIDAASLWLHRQRNPSLSREELRDSLGWSDSTFKRRERDLRQPGAVLGLWLMALQKGHIPVVDANTQAKLWWFEQVPHLMMVGTPPWTPSDYVDITPLGLIVVPAGATIQEYEKPVHRRPVYEQ